MRIRNRKRGSPYLPTVEIPVGRDALRGRSNAYRTLAVLGRNALGLFVATSLLSVRAAEQSVPTPGHQRLLSADRIGAEAAPLIDGVLDDAVWSRASVSAEFWNSIQGRPPSNQTEVRVLMDDKFLYFGFVMYDDEPGTIQSTRAVRDVGLGYDDSITIQLDSFFNRRAISEFSVNPAGTQTDEIAGGRSAKIEWKGDWTAAARRTDVGWSAEFAIPFAILNYEDDADTFGINFKRYQSRTREYSYWADVTPQVLNEEMGQLRDLNVPVSTDRKVWTFMPFMFAGVNVDDEQGVTKDSLAAAGIDVRYQPRPDLTGMFSVNPDFSQVEEAVTDISFSYSEKAVDENRPFFIEGADFFSAERDDNEYFYSNRVPDFDVGAKAFGRLGRAQFGVLTTQTPDDRVDLVARSLFEIDETNSASVSVVGIDHDATENVLAVTQLNGRHAPSGFTYSLDVAYTDTRGFDDPNIPDDTGHHYKTSLGWRGDYLYVKAGSDEYDVAYYPGNALLDEDLPGTKSKSVAAGFYREASNPLWRVLEASAGAVQRDTLSGERQEEKVFTSGSIEFNNDIRVGGYVEDGPYRPVTDTRGVFAPTLNDDRYYSMFTDFNSRSNRVSGGVQYDWGDLGGAPYAYYAAYSWWRPTNALYFNLTLERTDSFGITDQVVLVSSWDITPEHSLGTRLIHSDNEDYYRLAYSRRPRRGLDIFAIYDSSPFSKDEFSVKVVKTF